jgi:tRNA (guanine37-N1)-methyltransferase
MRIDVLTLFPSMFSPMNESMMWKAREIGALEFHTHDIRDYSTTKYRQVDDTPYGGGGGMVLKVDIVVRAVEAVRGDSQCPVILMSPQGRVFNHQIAMELSKLERMILLCGHYEGFDERVRELVVTDEISIGDYVLTGGELAAMVISDAVVRQLDGVLVEGGAAKESHADGLLEGAQYTRPLEFRGLVVPEVMRTGNHAQMQKWQRQDSLRRTWKHRPDMLLTAPLTEDDKYFLATLAEEDQQ